MSSASTGSMAMSTSKSWNSWSRTEESVWWMNGADLYAGMHTVTSATCGHRPSSVAAGRWARQVSASDLVRPATHRGADAPDEDVIRVESRSDGCSDHTCDRVPSQEWRKRVLPGIDREVTRPELV